MTKWPHSTYFWSLEQNALIMNPDFAVEQHIMDPKGLDKMMMMDLPVVPPDSVIKTFTHLKGEQIDFVLTQDKVGLAAGNFVIKRGEWARFFLDTWFDPLYRSYNFQKAETHALVCCRDSQMVGTQSLTPNRNTLSNGIPPSLPNSP